jgi:hypothetical protein
VLLLPRTTVTRVVGALNRRQGMRAVVDVA